jgi:hypothetical protein
LADDWGERKATSTGNVGNEIGLTADFRRLRRTRHIVRPIAMYFSRRWQVPRRQVVQRRQRVGDGVAGRWIVTCGSRWA